MTVTERSASEIIDRKLGQPLGAEHGGEGLVAGGQLGMGRGGAPVDGLNAHRQLVELAMRVIGAFGFHIHLLFETQGILAGSMSAIGFA